MSTRVSDIVVKHLSAAIGTRTLLHETEEFVLPAQKFIAVVGRNGAGKTTLLRTLLGVERWGTAEVHLSDVGELQKLDATTRARLITWIPEASPLAFPFSVYEVVLLGRYPWHQGLPSAHDHRLTNETLEILGLKDLATQFVNTLSSGERQRVLLARGLNNASPLIIIDEPTVNLDLYHELRVLKLLHNLTRRGKTVIAVLHNLNHVYRFADTAVLVDAGGVRTFSSAKDLFTGKTIATVFGVIPTLVKDEQGDTCLCLSIAKDEF